MPTPSPSSAPRRSTSPQTKAQTNVTEGHLQNVPRGASFQAGIQFAPGARSELLQGGYQIDGASNSENSYLVEGQETSHVITGSSATQVPMEFIKEVQLKSSGFEAQYGGALGGVVNVISRRGANAWHGSVVISFKNDALDAAPSRGLRYVPNTSTTQIKSNGVVVGTLDQPIEYFQAKKDPYSHFNPGFEIGGHLLKDRLWVWEQEKKGRIGLELYYTGRQRLEANPYRSQSQPYFIFGVMAERRIGPVRAFLNAENLGGVRQTKWNPLLRTDRAADGRWTVDAWAPLEGRVFNGGIRFEF